MIAAYSIKILAVLKRAVNNERLAEMNEQLAEFTGFAVFLKEYLFLSAIPPVLPHRSLTRFRPRPECIFVFRAGLPNNYGAPVKKDALPAFLQFPSMFGTRSTFAYLLIPVKYSCCWPYSTKYYQPV